MKKDFIEKLRSIGIVFGDIGTSPIYTLSTVAIILKQRDPNLIIGDSSLIFWLLILIVYLQYTTWVIKRSPLASLGVIKKEARVWGNTWIVGGKAWISF
jgi:K+ transporter